MAAFNTLNLIVDVTNPNKTGLLLSFNDRQPANVPLFIRNDGVSLNLRAVQPSTSTSRTWDDIDLSTASVILALGEFDKVPTSGTFTLTWGGNTTSALNYNASASDVQTALNALSGIGGVTVTNPSPGVYLVLWNTTGTRTLISGDVTGLAPQTGIVVSEVIVGSSAVKDLQTIQINLNPYALTNTWSAFPTSGSVVTLISAGTVSTPNVQKVALSPIPYDGTFQITTSLLTTAAIPYSATASQVQAALNTGGNNYVVTGNPGGPWIITTVANGSVATITVNASGLSVPVGLTGTLSLSTFSMLEAFINSSLNEITLLMELQITPAGGATATVLQVPVTVNKDVINSGALTPTPTIGFYTKTESDARFEPIKTTFANSTARASEVPSEINQLGLQLSDNTLWRSTATTAGSWVAVGGGGGNKVVTVALDSDRFALTSADVNNLDWVKVTEIIDGQRNVWGVVNNTKLSNAAGWVRLGHWIMSPVNTVAPTISGGAYVGVTLTCNHGTWTDSPTGYGYQWQVSADGSTGWTNIGMQTTSSYTPVPDDLTKFIRCAVTATNTAGTSIPIYTASSAAITYYTGPTPIAYWAFEETSGTRYDSSGNGYDLTPVTDNPGSTAGIIGLASSFEASDTALRNNVIQDALVLAGSFSITGWFNLTNYPSPAGFITAIWKTYQSAQTFLLAMFGSTLTAMWCGSDNNEQVVESTATINLNTTYFFALVYDGSAGTYSISVNAGTPDSLNVIAPIGTKTGNFVIGCGEGGGPLPTNTNPLLGWIDQVRVYNQAIDSTQIALDYGGGLGR